MAEAIEHPKLRMDQQLVCKTFNLRWSKDHRLQQQYTISDFSEKQEPPRVEWRDIPTEEEDERAAID